jgi:hypothetical protein
MTKPQNHNPTWWEAILKLWPAILIIGSGFTSYVLMNNEVKMLRKDIEALKDQVARQYGVQRDMNERTNNEIDDVRLWIEFHKGNIETWKMQQNLNQTGK